MDSRAFQLVIVVLCLTAVCTVGQDYEVMVENMDNTITATCCERVTGTAILNPTWYLNGARNGMRSCLNSTTVPGSNSVSFTISPDCEGFLQCCLNDRCSLPQRVYAYPTLTGEPIVTSIIAMPGTDVVFPCDLTVSAFNNFAVCWMFTTMSGNQMEEKFCTKGPDYSFRLSTVTTDDVGTYQCRATASTDNNVLKLGSPLLLKSGTSIMLVLFEPVSLTGEIKASFRDSMYQFSAPSAQGTTPYTHKWFINNIEDPTANESTLRTQLPNDIINTVMVSVSNQRDEADTPSTANRTAIIVNLCPTVNPTALPPSPVTLGTIVPAVLLVIFVILGFLTIFILLIIILCLYIKNRDLEKEKAMREQNLTDKEEEIRKLNNDLEQEKAMREQNLIVKEEEIRNLNNKIDDLLIEKGDLQRQISFGSDVDGFSDNLVGLQLVKIAIDIKNHCPRDSCLATFYLKVVGTIMNAMSEDCNESRFRNLVRSVRDNAQKLYDALVDEKPPPVYDPIDCGDRKVDHDDVSDLEDAKGRFMLYLEKLDGILKTEIEE